MAKKIEKNILAEKRLEATKLKMAIASGKEKNVRAYKNIRREVARLLTQKRAEEILETLKK